MEISRYGCPHPAWNDSKAAGCGSRMCPLYLFAFSIFNFSLSIHTGLAVEVTIGAVWTNRILPDDAGQVGTG